MTIRPLHDRILIRRSEADATTKGGIIIPDAAKEKPVQGVVIAVGTGKLLENGTLVPLTVKAGDRILYSKYSGVEVKLDDGEHMIVREDEILGVVES